MTDEKLQNLAKIKKFTVLAYDKDSDYYYEILITDIYDYAECKAIIFAEMVKNDEFRNPNNNEPFDWIIICDETDNQSILWTSYE